MSERKILKLSVIVNPKTWEKLEKKYGIKAIKFNPYYNNYLVPNETKNFVSLVIFKIRESMQFKRGCIGKSKKLICNYITTDINDIHLNKGILDFQHLSLGEYNDFILIDNIIFFRKFYNCKIELLFDILKFITYQPETNLLEINMNL